MSFDLSTIAPITKPRKATEKFSWLVYSLPGVGKTRFAGSIIECPQAGKPLLLDFEDGSSSLSKLYPDVDVVHIDDWATGMQIVEALINEEHDYGTVIFDTIGEAQEQIKAWSVKTHGETNSYKKWEEVWEQAGKAIKYLHKHSKMNVIALAHVDREKDEILRSMMFQPYFQGKKSTVEMPKVFDQISYMAVADDPENEGEMMRVLQNQPSGDKVAKDRSDSLPQYLFHPTFKKIYEIWEEAEKAAEAEAKASKK